DGTGLASRRDHELTTQSALTEAVMTGCPRSFLAALLLTSAVMAPRAGAQSSPPKPRTRTYFIAADPVTWDYVPGGRDEVAGTPYVDTAFFAKGPPRAVSTVYKKVLYREYTD